MNAVKIHIVIAASLLLSGCTLIIDTPNKKKSTVDNRYIYYKFQHTTPPEPLMSPPEFYSTDDTPRGIRMYHEVMVGYYNYVGRYIDSMVDLEGNALPNVTKPKCSFNDLKLEDIEPPPTKPIPPSNSEIANFRSKLSEGPMLRYIRKIDAWLDAIELYHIDSRRRLEERVRLYLDYCNGT